MKKVLFIGLFFAYSLFGICQNSISELQKGLIFSAPLSGNYPTTDLVSGSIGVGTAIYNTQDRQGNGGTRYLIYNGTSSYSSFTAIAAFGSGDFMVTAKIQVGALGAVRTILGGAANAFDLNISATGYLTAKIMGGSALTASTTLLANSTVYKVSYSRTGTTGTYYVNGVAAGTCTDSNNYIVGCTLAGNGTGYFNGSIFMVRAFNWAASITNYSKPEYPIEWVNRGATGADLLNGWDLTNWNALSGVTINSSTRFTSTSQGGIYGWGSTGTLIVGKNYKLNIAGTTAGGNTILLRNYNQDVIYGTISTTTFNSTFSFLAQTDVWLVLRNNIAAQTDITAMSIYQLGCVLDLNASGLSNATSGYWYDKTNSLTATNSSTSLAIGPASNLGATSFNGSTSNIAFTGMNGLTGDITISCWVNTLGLINYGRIFSNTEIQLAADNGVTATLQGITLKRGTGYTATGTYSLPLNTFINITVTSVAGDKSKIYFNGVLMPLLYDGTSSISSNTDYTLGYIYTGNISRVNIWNRILDESQIKLVYDSNF